MPFKLGTFNIVPTFVTVTLAVAGIGALPYGLRYLLNGEVRFTVKEPLCCTAPVQLSDLQAPTLRDRFENYVLWRKGTWDKDAPYSVTREFSFDREAMEAEWVKWHIAAGNVPGATIAQNDPFLEKLQ